MNRLELELWLPCRPSVAFDLLADVRSLDKVTPGWFRLIPREPVPRRLTIGSTVDYRLRWRGLPLRWSSLIRVWDRPSEITYEQAKGPFRSFRHEHLFFEHAGGVRVVDRVFYETPGSGLLRRCLIEPDLVRIFTFRRVALRRLLENRSV